MDYFNAKILGCKIHDVSKSISINFQKSPEDDDESDKHLEARDRRYSCLKKHFHKNFNMQKVQK